MFRILSENKNKWPKYLHKIIWQSVNSGITFIYGDKGGITAKSISIYRWFKNNKIKFHWRAAWKA